METILINTENSKTNKSNKFFFEFTDMLNLKNPNKNIALANLRISYPWKTLNLHIAAVNLKYLLQRRMMNLIHLMYHILFQTLKIISNILDYIIKNIKL